MEVVSEKKGEKSIQINSLKHILNDSRFRSFDNFVAHYDDVEIVYINKKKRYLLISEFS